MTSTTRTKLQSKISHNTARLFWRAFYLEKKMNRVMIVDAYNQFIRGYIVDPSKNPNGDPIGGIRTFINITNKLTREIKPDLVGPFFTLRQTTKSQFFSNFSLSNRRTKPKSLWGPHGP